MLLVLERALCENASCVFLHTAVTQTDFGASALGAEQTSAQTVPVTGRLSGQERMH